MNAVVPLLDMISFAAFAFAAFVTASFEGRKGGVFDRWVRRFLIAAFVLYAAVGVSNSLEHLGVTSFFDTYEDYGELLFVPLLAYAAHQAHMRSIMNERARAYWALNREHELTLNVIDTVPCGVVIVDDAGRITFANSAARRTLELSEDPASGAEEPVGWVAVGESGEPAHGTAPGTLPAFAASTEAGVRQKLLWPNGDVTVLSVSSTAMLSRAGGAGGSVVAFEVVGAES